MLTRTIGFIGAGRIARVLLKGWQRAGIGLTRIVATDVDVTVIERLPMLGGRVEASVGDLVKPAQQDIVFLALHPPCIPPSLEQITGRLPSTTILVSLAPKFTIAQLTAHLGGFDRIVRVIPNAPSLVGAGYNPSTFGPVLDAADHRTIQQLFAPLGAMPEVPEQMLEVYAVITAMGPTYFWPQLGELISLAEAFGLTDAAATEAVTQMIVGSATALASSGLTADELLDLIPVRPLDELQGTIREAYRAKLTAILEKIRP